MLVSTSVRVLLVLVILGCSATADAVRTRAAEDFGCSPEAVGVSGLGSGAARAIGCGKVATYVCARTERSVVCTRDSDIEATESRYDSVSAAAPTENGDLVLDAASRCLDPGVGIEVEFDGDGTATRFRFIQQEDPTARLCLSRALLSVSGPPSTRRRYVVPAAVRAEPEAAREPEGSTAPSEIPSPDDAVLRAAIDEHKADLLACAASDRVAIRIRVTDGIVSVDLHGTDSIAITSCVRSILSDLVVPDGTDLIHVVRATPN